VLRGDQPLAFLVLGDQDDDALSVSAIIKHLNYLQILTNIVVSAIENQRLSKEALKKEQEKQKLIAEQNEMLEEQVAVRTSELRKEKEESERLLNNILPKVVAKELKESGHTTPQKFDNVSMLFTDFKNFTATAAQIDAKTLVSELDDIFKNFDQIMEKWGLEKIKTIGDAYMAGSGFPKKHKQHALYCVKAGQDMIKYLKIRAKTAKIKWEMRVGINSGPIVAGVVGAKKFTYDVWGDTVNTAARMESNGVPGKVNVSASTYRLVRRNFECLHRGKLEAKGKGEVDMYFIKKEKVKVKPPVLGMSRDSQKTINRIKRYVIGRLKRELDPIYTYHAPSHTLDVFESAIRLALRENISEKDFELLQVAALLHDSGFLVKSKGHEEESCKLAQELLPTYKYSEDEIKQVCSIIMATKLPQSPKNHVEEIICDADLDYLGRDDFYKIGRNLWDEMNAGGMDMDEVAWHELQVSFLSNHKYFTVTARSTREPGKQKHLSEVEQTLKEMQL
jgi:class 3 adenylate cyclase